MSTPRAATPRSTLRNIYLYLVCFASLLIAVFALVAAVRAAAELLYPDPGGHFYHPVDPEIDRAELERQEQASRDSARRYSILSLISAITTLALAGPIYLYHWRQVQREFRGPGGTSDTAPAAPVTSSPPLPREPGEPGGPDPGRSS